MKRFLTKHEREFHLTFVAIMVVLIIIVLSTGNAKGQGRNEDALKYHQKLQNEYSYETWCKNQPKKKVKQARYMVLVSKERAKEDNQEEKLNRKIDRIKQRMK